MGWKTFKERYNIEHIVQIEPDKGICIGSQYCYDLAWVNIKNGVIVENSTFPGFVKKHYQALWDAQPADVLKAIKAKDEFARSITVYKWDGGNIIECFCEKVGWPNITHDGEIMYDNRFSTNKAKVVAWAKRDAIFGIKAQTEHIENYKEKIKERQKFLDEDSANLGSLNLKYPEIEAAV